VASGTDEVHLTTTSSRVEFARYCSHIAALPAREPLLKSDLMTPTFLVAHESTARIYYVPFHHRNEHARLALIGLTPGWTQMETAYRIARRALLDDRPAEEVWDAVDDAASFAGSMRTNLIRMLDALDLPAHLRLDSSAQLFAERRNLLHTTSAIRDAVFINGENYTGHRPKLLKSPLLLTYVRRVLAPELRRVPEALIIPLGDVVAKAVQLLADEGLLERERCLLGFPHPSAANGHRHRQFKERRDVLVEQVRLWFAGAGTQSTAASVSRRN
jgi:hypothetical protein